MSLTVMALPLQDCSVDEPPLAIGVFIIQRYVLQSIMMTIVMKNCMSPSQNFSLVISNRWNNEYTVF